MARRNNTMVKVIVWVIVVAMVITMLAGVATIALG